MKKKKIVKLIGLRKYKKPVKVEFYHKGKRIMFVAGMKVSKPTKVEFYSYEIC